jgi:hypothetical protein
LFKEDIRQWPLGNSKVKITLTAKNSPKPIYESDITYERIETPQWYKMGHDLGKSNEVLKPWTPIKWDGKKLGVWGREYFFGSSLFPEQIASSNEPVLAKPISLNAVCDGKTFKAGFETRKTVSAESHKVVTQSKGKMGDIGLTLVTTTEYDGMVKFELEIEPNGKVAVSQLYLTIPFKSQRALYYNTGGDYYDRGFAGSIPAAGLNEFFRPYFWIGDDERGLMWFAESTQGWNSSNRPIRVIAGSGSTELRIEFVNQPLDVNKPRKIVFGLQATPVKPVPKDYRAWRADVIRDRTTYVDWEGQGIPLKWRVLWWNGNFDGAFKPTFMPGHCTPLQIRPVLADYVKKYHDKGTPLLPYFYLCGVNSITTGFERYYPIWQPEKSREATFYGVTSYSACPSSSLGDLYLYGYDEMVKKYGVDGIYFDGAGPPSLCDNVLHGHGWVDEKGIRYPFYPIFDLRDFYKRLATILGKYTDNPIIWVHLEEKMASPCFSFCAAFWEGEWVMGGLKAEGAYLSDIQGLDWWRARGLAAQWGIVPMWLPFTSGSPEQQLNQSRDIMALLLVHGTPLGSVGFKNKELLTSVWKAQAVFDIGKAEFHGYWQNTDSLNVRPQDKNIVASYYEKDGKLMIVVSNFTKQQQDVTLKFKVPPKSDSFKDVVSDEMFKLDKGKVAVPVGVKSFRLLVSM